MGHGLEVRVPYLDNTVIDQAERAKNSFLIDSLQTKKTLFNLAKRHLPSSVWDRPKHGFTVPIRENLKKQWSDLALESIRNLQLKTNFLDKGTLEKVLSDITQGRKHSSVIYSLTVLGVWLESF